jgi:glutathione S-transferase
MEEHLGRQDWFAGAGPSLADIALYAYTHICEGGGFRLRDYANICAWLKRIAALPGYLAMA